MVVVALSLTIVLLLPGPVAQPAEAAHVALAAQRLAAWYAPWGVTIDLAAIRIEPMNADPCAADVHWLAMSDNGGAYLYLVDSRCPVLDGWDGATYLGHGVAVVRWETPSVDAVIAHEVGHLLGASDDPDGWGIMSPQMVEAYYERQVGERAWAEWGLAPERATVMLPAVMGEG